MLQGDFGRSFQPQPPRAGRGAGAVQRHADAGRHSFVLCSVLGILAGVVSAANQYGLADKAITFVVLLGISMPSFFLGMMMILTFAVNLRWFPASGMWPIYGGGDCWALIDHLTMPASRWRWWPRA
jgi:peptide/nickel transport system permease protein